MESSQLMMFDEMFTDHLGPSDWIIPNQEVSARRFLRQTAKHNIYKADWFGDVLVYEPRSKLNDQKIDMRLRRKKQPLNPIELTLKLDSLRSSPSSKTTMRSNTQQHYSPLCSPCSWSSSTSTQRNSMKKSRSQQSLASCDAFNEASFDSAYSSITSTPLYNTKTNNISKFEFPINCRSSESSSSYELTSPMNQKQQQTKQQHPGSENIHAHDNNLNNNNNNDDDYDCIRQQKSTKASRAVILNKQSYIFSQQREEPERGQENDYDEEHGGCEIDWLELNELRLIAHEGFMLFMGASLENKQAYTNEKLLGRDQDADSAALVIEMNHPKATSLHDLLHNVSASMINFHQAITSSSPTLTQFDRFFQRQLCTNNQSRKPTSPLLNRQTPIFSFADKLAICQQVINAMTYLHDKNICHGRLTSTNIYIEPNQTVKISLIDEHETPLMTESSAGPMIADVTSLTYLSPELIRTIEVNSECCASDKRARCRLDLDKIGKMSDVFAFGTILYELFEERFPFSLQGKSTSMPPADQLIYLIGSGRISQTNIYQNPNRRLPQSIADAIVACWTTDVSYRPQFKQLILSK